MKCAGFDRQQGSAHPILRAAKLQGDLYMTVLRLKDCRLGNTGAVSLAEYITSFMSASLVELALETSDIRAGGGGALAETLRCNTTLSSLNLRFECVGWGG